MNAPNYPLALNHIMHLAVQQRIAELAGQLANLAQWGVLAGPFSGMVLPQNVSWGHGDLAPKLLGSYEAELHGSIERAVGRQPEVVINVGCAEGYYAIGLARALPNARVYAFDLNEAAQKCCAEAAELNGVADRVTIGGFCEPERLVELAATAERVLIVLDCEGGERELLNAATAPHLGHCDIIVECHDFLDRNITPNLRSLFGGQHETAQLREGARDPAQHGVLASLSSLDRWLLVCEFRQEVQHWLTFWAARS